MFTNIGIATASYAATLGAQDRVAFPFRAFQARLSSCTPTRRLSVTPSRLHAYGPRPERSVLLRLIFISPSSSQTFRVHQGRLTAGSLIRSYSATDLGMRRDNP